MKLYLNPFMIDKLMVECFYDVQLTLRSLTDKVFESKITPEVV